MLMGAGKLEIQPLLFVAFDWPLKAVGSAADGFGYHGISNFVDQDPSFPDDILDYNCGARSYDLAGGYNHRGIDIFPWPFYWTWMDNDEVHVVAAEAGTIVLKSDGNFDENCGFGGGNWNAVYVQHGDGSVAWYGHLKSGSLTAKTVGQAVLPGEYLGVVGSSGNSTGPHLHFEVYDSANNLVDPYAGPCNAMNTRSWWREQSPYYDSAVNRLMIGTDSIEYPDCPGREITYEAATIARGTVAYFTTFYRDLRSSQVSQWRIRRPDGSVFQAWSDSLSSPPHYAAAYWWWSWFIPSNEPAGQWTFEVDYEGQVYAKGFTVV
jgi:murein DD-endopeptidase MepM/ murein hydrolase activator NlpD